ncbi:MAG: hypothetical protein ACMG6H_16645 [Acidobacteriota bacterium]
MISQRVLIQFVGDERLSDLVVVNADAEGTWFVPYEAWRSLQSAETWLVRTGAKA